MDKMQVNPLAVMVADSEQLRSQCDEIFKLRQDFSDIVPAYDQLLHVFARGLENGSNELLTDTEFNAAIIDIAGKYESIGIFSYYLRCANQAIEKHVIQSLDARVQYTYLLQLNAVVFSALESAARHTAKKISHALLHSQLTGLRNKTAFEGDLKTHMDKGHSTHIVYIDMDGLKTLNDSQGHAAGDKALSNLGSVLSAAMSEGQSCYHFSGDEFGIVDITNTVEELALQLGKINVSAENKFSFGIATWSSASQDIEAVIKAADLNMQSQKKIRRATGQAAERGATPVAGDQLTG